MSTHTPGPWHVENDGVWTLIRGIDPELGDDYPGPMVATTTNNGREEINARLIAAAPDLLAVLKEILAAGLIADRQTRGFQAYTAARAAIAKAEGVS